MVWEPVTAVGLGRSRDGRYRPVTAVGKVVRGPLLEIGNTTSRVDFGRQPGEWTDAWCGSAVGHHWARGDRPQPPATTFPELRALSVPSGLELVEVTV